MRWVFEVLCRQKDTDVVLTDLSLQTKAVVSRVSNEDDGDEVPCDPAAKPNRKPKKVCSGLEERHTAEMNESSVYRLSWSSVTGNRHCADFLYDSTVGVGLVFEHGGWLIIPAACSTRHRPIRSKLSDSVLLPMEFALLDVLCTFVSKMSSRTTGLTLAAWVASPGSSYPRLLGQVREFSAVVWSIANGDKSKKGKRSGPSGGGQSVQILMPPISPLRTSGSPLADRDTVSISEGRRDSKKRTRTRLYPEPASDVLW
jgi:hypothetical protein